MQRARNDMNLVMITENNVRAAMLRDAMARGGVDGIIRRIEPGAPAVDCAHQRGNYREKPMPDLIFFDFTEPSDDNISVLEAIAFGDRRARVPVVLLTSEESQDLLDNGDVGEASAVMFSPTSLLSFIRKLTVDKRPFLKAVHTLYQYGPILVRPPQSIERYAKSVTRLSA